MASTPAGRVVAVGLGPAGPEHLTAGTLEAIDGADQVVLRTSRHPSAAAVLDRRPDATTFDAEYDVAESFETLYPLLAERLLAIAIGGATVCYAVPGSPTVAERTVELLRAGAGTAGVDLVVEPALSFVDLALARIGIDPVGCGLRLVDAARFAADAAGGSGPLLVAQVWSRQLLSEVKLALEEPPPGQRATLLHHLGLPDEQVVEVAWADLDRTLQPDHLTSLYVDGLPRPPAAALAEFAATVATLRERCPWDREQTHASLLRHLVEESYEALEALEGLGDDPQAASAEAAAHAEEELGDLLCQVVFHATLGAEEGLFTLSDIARTVNDKLVARHPHVFGDVVAETADDVLRNWERSKDEAKGRSHLLEGVPAAMPALARVDKAERKLESVGLGAEATAPGGDELAAALGRLLGGEVDPAVAEEAAGDLLLGIGRLLSRRRIDPEAACRRALDRLGERVAALEAEAAAAGADLALFTGDETARHRLHLPLC